MSPPERAAAPGVAVGGGEQDILLGCGIDLKYRSSVKPVLAATAWPSNAELIADVAQLYIDADALVLDVTYGRGVAAALAAGWWLVEPPRDEETS